MRLKIKMRQISKQLKKGQNKKYIDKFEKQLEDLKSSTDDGDIIKGKILELDNLIKKILCTKSGSRKTSFKNKMGGRRGKVNSIYL